MIIVFINKDGYSILGEGLEIAHKCSQALSVDNRPIFSELTHTYKVLQLALKELQGQKIEGDIFVYNDSRIVDEMSNSIKPLDTDCEKWSKEIRRNIIPKIKASIFFRKRSSDYISKNISLGFARLLQNIPVERLLELERPKDYIKKSALDKFRRKV